MNPNPEAALYGFRWDSFHGGYFSDPDVAKPLAGTIVEIARQADARAIVDLGGGTGFVLSQLEPHGLDPATRLINLDASPDQIAQSRMRRINCVRASFATFNRAQVAPRTEHVVWIMRSALHYCGEAHLPAVLHHLRSQAEPGEFFIHQTACFDRVRDADCLNTLYREMGTDKWYPTADHLHQILAETGWHVQQSHMAPALPLARNDLATRYHVPSTTMRRIRVILSRDFGPVEGVLALTPKDFCAFLHYRIITCVAALPTRL